MTSSRNYVLPTELESTRVGLYPGDSNGQPNSGCTLFSGFANRPSNVYSYDKKKKTEHIRPYR